MRASPSIISAVFLLAAGCASLSGRAHVHVVVWNDAALAQRIQVSIDGERVLDEVASVSTSEPSIVSTTYLRLRSGLHRIEATREGVTSGLTFTVRPGTRTDVHIRLRNGETLLDVSYGEKLYI